jgi:ABC-type transport system involved in multi-copper enzyme maturation permease subunit
MLGAGEYLWRLIPANPILLRVVETGGKRRRDLFIRCGYLGLLVVVVIISLFSSINLASANLTELASTSGEIFRVMSYLQLGLVALLAPIFTAGAITQEKDSQTYDILLATPLTNGQIVLGSLLSRLFFVIALLVSGIPIFSITQVFGGVAVKAIVYSFLIAAATAFVTGAIAMAIATFKVGTRRTIFSFYLFVVIYLVGIFLLDQLTFFRPIVRDVPAETSFLTPFHPFLALRVIFSETGYMPPSFGDLPDHLKTWPIGWALSSPHTFYIAFMFFLSFVLITPSVFLLRRVAQSTLSFKSWILQKLHLSRGTITRKPRVVWANPIAWREAKTKASAFRATLVRYGFIAAGVVGAVVLVVMYASTSDPPKYITATAYNAQLNTLTVHTENGPVTYRFDPRTTNLTFEGKRAPVDALYQRAAVTQVYATTQNVLQSINLAPITRTLSARETRQFLLGAIIVEFAAILLIVTNAAASTVTREKEDGSLDLLLSTPITSRYYIWGKLRGLVMFVVPLIAVPVISALLFIIYDFFSYLTTPASQRSDWIVLPESVLLLPIMMIIICAFAAILGMQMSLRLRRTVVAVMSSVGIVVGICGAMGWCGFAMLENTDAEITMAIAAFSPFTLITVLVDPTNFAGRIFDTSTYGTSVTQQDFARVMLFFGTLAAVAIYAVIVWAMYKSMVKNFDMTIRRQSR